MTWPERPQKVQVEVEGGVWMHAGGTEVLPWLGEPGSEVEDSMERAESERRGEKERNYRGNTQDNRRRVGEIIKGIPKTMERE